jgi:hypothetical protein
LQRACEIIIVAGLGGSDSFGQIVGMRLERRVNPLAAQHHLNRRNAVAVL